MANFMFHLCVFLFLLIQGVDMILTKTFIGDDWTREACVPMSWLIQHHGIDTAVLTCRALTFFFVVSSLCLKRHAIIRNSVIVFTVIYYLVMVNWLFTLGYVSW